MHRFPPPPLSAAVAVVVAVGGCSSSGSKPAPATPATTASSSTAPSTTSPGSTASGGSSTAVSASQIVISNFAFSPKDLTVHPGQTVTVVNNDSTAHTLTAAPGKTFDTGTIEPGKSATFTAPATVGAYPYICTIHQFMHGTLTVA